MCAEEASPVEVNGPDLSSLLSQIELGFKRRDKDACQQVFATHKDDSGKLSQEALPKALLDLGIEASPLDIEDIFREMDTDNSESLTFQEFWKGTQMPTVLDQWSQTVPITKLLSDAIPHKGEDSLKYVSEMTEKDIAIVVEAFSSGLKQLLTKEVASLKQSFAAVETKEKATKSANDKFGVITMSAGNIDDFHAGLAGRVGQPHLDFMNACQAEHCVKAGARIPFTTSNYNITTTPEEEWNIVVNRKATEAMDHDRTIADPGELMESEEVKTAGLTKVEVIILILYTGPMYMVYNAILRRWPASMYEVFEAGENLYPSTIHVLVSAVQKLARVVKMPQGLMLYRGLGGKMDLPPGFYKCAESGTRGMAEWGFMSTTSHKEVALMYSGVQQGRPLAMVLEVKVGAVDRGACIRRFSQYPQEVEYLWVPCSYLEPVSYDYLEITEWGPVTMIPVRVNANLKTMVIEDLVAQKKNMHLASFKFILDELERDLLDACDELGAAERLERDTWTGGITLQAFLERINEEGKSVYARHAKMLPEDYTKEKLYQGVVLQMLDVRSIGMSKLRYWIDNEEITLSSVYRMPGRLARRHRMACMEKRALALTDPEAAKQAAVEVCKLGNLVSESVDELNEIEEPLMVFAAADGRGSKQLKLMKLAGADVDAACWADLGQAYGRKIVSYPIIAAASFGNDDTIMELHKLGASIEIGTYKNQTAIHMAARFGHPSTIEVLAGLGADVNMQTTMGETPVMEASKANHAECVVQLCKLSADVNIKNREGSSCLHYAAGAGHTTVVEALLAEGAEVDAKDGCLWTPLMFAASQGHLTILETLHVCGAAVDSTTKNGGTALLSAARAGHTDIVAALERYGCKITDDVTLLLQEATSRKGTPAEALPVLCTSRFNDEYYCDIFSVTSVDNVWCIRFSVHGDGSLGPLQGANQSRLWSGGAPCRLVSIAISVESTRCIAGTLNYQKPDGATDSKLQFSYGKSSYEKVDLPTADESAAEA